MKRFHPESSIPCPNVAPDTPHSNHGRVAPIDDRNVKTQTGADQ